MESSCCTYIYVVHMLLISVGLISGQTVVEGVVGGSVVLPCTLTPQGDLQWKAGETVVLIKTVNGKVIIPDSLWNGDVGLVGESDLEIRSLRRGRDDGTDSNSFTCSYTGGGSTQIQITLLAPIIGVQIPEANNGKVTLTAGTPKTLSCSVSGDPTTPIYYTWEVNGNVVSGENSMTFNLIANKTTKMVRCRAFNKHSNGAELSSRDVTVTLNVLSPITGVQIQEASNGNVTLTAGTPKTLTCSVLGDPTTPIYYTWEVNGNVVRGQNSLTFNLIANRTTKMVRCRAYNRYSNGTDLSAQDVTVRLNVLSPITGVQIREASNGNVTLTAGTPKALTCSVSGDPTSPIYYIWEVNGNYVSGQNSMTFNLIANKATRMVRCRAYNRYRNGTELSSQDGIVTLNVLYLNVPVSQTYVNVTEGERITIKCTTEGNPQPTFKWLRSNTIKSESSILTIVEVSRSDAGSYICRVNNSVGIKEATVNLTVLSSQTTSPRDSTDGASGAIGGAIGGSIAAVVVVIIVAIVVWKQRNRASHHGETQGSSPSTNSRSMGMNGLTDGDTVKVYDNLGTNPDYVNTVEEKTYTSLSQKEKNNSDVQRVGVMSIQKGAQSSNDTQYEDMTITNKTIHSPEYSNMTRDIGDNKTYENSVVPEESQHNYYNCVQ